MQKYENVFVEKILRKCQKLNIVLADTLDEILDAPCCDRRTCSARESFDLGEIDVEPCGCVSLPKNSFISD